jgi:hypothetical protein
MKKQTWRTSRRSQTGGNSCVALIFFVTGIFFCFLFLPLGILIVLGSLLLDARFQRVHFCCYCGNEVAPTSLRCPTCGADNETCQAEAEAERQEKAAAAAAKKHPHLYRR